MATALVEKLPAEPKAKPAGKIRKRAAKACLSCRARKVRCDVSQRGRPCMNCYLDNECCEVKERASRFRRAQREVNTDAQNARSAEDVVRSRLNGEPSSPKAQQQSGSPQPPQEEETQDIAMEDMPLQETREPSRPPVAKSPPSRNMRMYQHCEGNVVPAANIKELNTAPMLQTADASQWFGDQRIVNADITYSYYPFLIVNNMHNIMPQDVNYLESQGCFRLPTKEILHEFVEQYFLHVHPLVPMINEGDFWDMYGKYGMGGSGERMSLLVFQSMLFTSCNFVSRSSIKSMGFSSIRAARAAFYRRAKLLHDFDSESSMVYLAQAALLLSHWSPNFTQAFKKANSIWLSIAIQSAKSAEAPYYASKAPVSQTTDPAQYKRQNVLKRLWWCCIIRDRIMCLGLRRSLKITRAHFDFDAVAPLGVADLEEEVHRSRVYNAETKRCLTEIIVQIVELCSVLTDLIMLVFPLDDSPGWGKNLGVEEAVKVRECKQALRRWYKSASLRMPMFGGDTVPRMPVSGGQSRQHDSVILFTNLMYMYYHSSRVALSHHEVLQTAVGAASGNLSSNLKEFSSIYENRHELQDATYGVTECLKELLQLQLARWLPISAVACTALPLVLHVIDVKLSSHNKSNAPSSERSAQDAAKQHRLNILIEAMKTYQPQYDGVDYISETIRHIVNLAQLDTPAPPEASPSNISDWTDILASQPGCYLRLAMTMDLSLSKGRLPEEADFPASLQGLFTAGYSSVKALMGSSKPAVSAMQQQNRYTAAGFCHDPALYTSGVPMVPGTVHSLSSDADTNSPGSQHDSTRLAPIHGNEQEVGGDNINDHLQMDELHTAEFLDAALEMEGLAGEVFAAYTLHNESPQSLSTSEDEASFYEDEENAAEDWIGRAWGDEARQQPRGAEAAKGDTADQETAKALLDALRDGETVDGGA